MENDPFIDDLPSYGDLPLQTLSLPKGIPELETFSVWVKTHGFPVFGCSLPSIVKSSIETIGISSPPWDRS
jgi:hypothetical protein